MTTGERIRERREELNMTQKELAEKVGISFQLVSHYEKNLVDTIPTKRLKAIAEALRCSPYELMEGVKAQEGLTASQIRCIEMIKAATPEQMAKIESIITLVMQ